MSTQASEQVVRKTLVVDCPVERAFAVFTNGITEWWPVRTYSVGEERVVGIRLEGRVGGRMAEIWDDGGERPWGTVTAWEPPSRLAVSWKVNPDAVAETEWEVRFEPQGDATRVELTHRGWERLGTAAADSFSSYDRGWAALLELYAGAIAATA